MRSYQFPMTVSRDWYVTRIGGHTADLEAGEVGINVEALVQNTELRGGERVRIRPFEDTPHPLFRRPVYEVVPVGGDLDDGVALSGNGEAVLPLEDSGLRSEEEVIINSARPPVELV
ncbi:MAG: hypothetical protein MAG715_00707 [Methanonatronarchaeales archaeon]|nr:hypothetical protein [Methanonatronarchaeales archaeon]